MNSGHDQRHVDPLLPGYILDALDPTERSEVTAHLRDCARCRREADHDRAVAMQIGFAAPRRTPPPDLKQRLMIRVAREAQPMPAGRTADGHGDGMRPLAAVPSAQPSAPPVSTPQGGAPTAVARGRRRLPRWFVAAAILPWVLVIALAALLAGVTRQPPRASIAVAAVVGARGPYGWFAMAPDATKGRLMLRGLPALPRDERYVCWLETASRVDRACVFRTLSSSDAVDIPVSTPQSMRRYTRIAVTVEKGAPTGFGGTVLASGLLRQ